MALSSPGIQVTVTDESNYAPNQTGSVAYVLLATGQDKTAPGGGIAAGTTAENVDKLFAITSQRDLITTFGTPSFHKTSSGAPINGSEQNEYGLLAAYSALGVSNQIYVQRANVNLDSLEGRSSRPVGSVDDGTYWFDVATSESGVYEWDAGSQTFNRTVPLVSTVTFGGTPPTTYGSIGDYLVDTGDIFNPLYYKGYNNTWTEVGSTEWQAQLPAVTGSTTSPVITANGNIIINGDTISVTIGNNVSVVSNAINLATIDGVSSRVANNRLVISVTSDSASNGTVVDGSANISFSSSAISTGTTGLGIAAGQYWAPATAFSSYFSQPEWLSIDDQPRPTGSVWMKTSALGLGTNAVIKKYNTATAQWTSIPTKNFYSNGEATYNYDPVAGGLNIPVGTLWSKYNIYGDGRVASAFIIRKNSGPTVVVGTHVPTTGNNTDSFQFQITQPGINGYSSTYTVVAGGTGTPANFVAAISALNIPNLQAQVNGFGLFEITHLAGGDIRFLGDVSGTPMANLGLVTGATNLWPSLRGDGNIMLGTNWEPLSVTTYQVSPSEPYAESTDGTLWYNNSVTRVDLMINTGNAWRAFNNVSADIRGYDLSTTNSNGVIAATTPPAAQDDGTALVYGDMWLDTSDLENYPMLYRYQSVNAVDQWVLIDKTDNLSQNGIIFADARWGTGDGDRVTVDPALGTFPTIGQLKGSDYTDLDAPDPSLYPRGILLFNTRASGYNVKQWKANYFVASAYPNETLPTDSNDDALPGTWVSVSGYDDAGVVPKFGRNAARSVVVAALKSAIDSSTALKEEQNQFNIIACPGYPELIPNMINLNTNRNNTAFVIGDTPLRLPATGTDIIAWATNTAENTSTNESGLVNHSPYLGVFYPHGQTTDLSGNTIVVPASHAMIRTFVKSDNASYPWFAPAGARRGAIDNIDSIGYVDATSGAFITIGVGQGLRDVMYTNSVNPLTILPGIGLVNYGNKTTSGDSTAMSRINVSRLINYIRLQLDKIGRPFLFEPNDTITRNQIKTVVENLLNDLVTKRGVTDYLVVCDGTNNTPSRIAANELWVDVAVQPTKDVEFIYIPIRLTNAGQLQSNNIAPSANPGTGA